MHADPPVTDLVTRARNGDQQAWDALVDRYAPLIWSICRRNHLSRAGAIEACTAAGDSSRNSSADGRDPATIPSLLATITQRECCRVRRAAHPLQTARQALDDQITPDGQTAIAEQELAFAERNAALHAAFLRLPPSSRQLLTLLLEQPPMPDTQISATLGIPAASIGPNRARCLELLRLDPAIAALLNADDARTAGERRGQVGMAEAT